MGIAEELRVIPADAAGVIELARRFLSRWEGSDLLESNAAGESEVSHAEQRLGLRLPAALRWALTSAAYERGVIGRQDPLLPPSILEVDNGIVVYRKENQNCAIWGVSVTSADQVDPPVFWKDMQRNALQEWQPYQERLSVDLLEMVITDVMLRPGANVLQMELVSEELPRLGQFEQIGIPNHVFWPIPGGPPVKWFGKDDCLIRSDGDVWLWALGQSSDDLDVIRRSIPGDWDSLEY